MRFLWILLPLLACNTPSFEFSGVPAQRVIVEKSVFDVRMIGDRAEAIRINREWAPHLGYTAARFARAFEAASGCTVRPNSMQGDQVTAGYFREWGIWAVYKPRFFRERGH